VLLAPYPDTENPPAVANCNGGTGGQSFMGMTACYFDDFGSEIDHNTLTNNGSYNNPGVPSSSNVDLAEISNAESSGNCWHDNVNTGGTVTSDPPSIQSPPHSQCGIPDSGEPVASQLGAQVACDTQLLGSCPLPAQAATYPRADPTKIKLAMPPPQTTMPNPCADVPRNAWCPNNPENPAPYQVPGAPYTPGIFGSTKKGGSGTGAAGKCAKRKLALFISHRRNERIVKVQVFVNGKRVLSRKGRSLRRLTISMPLGRRAKVRIVTVSNAGHRAVRTRTVAGCATK
jgi:hypothetical protein